ncbi:MAG: transposase [Gammaproteobacteria bacterium]|nr:transposase [Gammaproteobacteria bacterium]
MGNKKRRQYSAEFKREAVELAMRPGQTIVGTAADLGVATSSTSSLEGCTGTPWVQRVRRPG